MQISPITPCPSILEHRLHLAQSIQAARVVQIYTPTRPKGWRYTKKIIYHDTIESVKGHKNSKHRDFLIAH